MVCLGACLLEKSRSYKKEFKPQKPANKLSNQEIREYLIATEMPTCIASPLYARGSKIEFVSGRTGDLIYEGALGIGEEFMKENAGRRDAYIRFNTYFNKVLEQAVKRGIVRLRKRGHESFSDISGMKIKHALEETCRQLHDRPFLGFRTPRERGYDVPLEELSKGPIVRSA